MTVHDEQRRVVYGSPPWPSYRDEIQSEISEGLRARYAVTGLATSVVLMQLRELDRKIGNSLDGLSNAVRSLQ